MSAPTNRTSQAAAKAEKGTTAAPAAVTDPLASSPGSSKQQPSTSNISNIIMEPLQNLSNKVLQKYPVLKQWKSRKAFLSAQSHVLGILFVAYIMNNWPVSYPREDNHSEPTFWFMMAALAAASAYTMQYKASTRGVQLLSRAQTEEWKGWMQFVFIMYHYYRNRTIYNEIRVLVSAYVWMTGFGHFLYCDKKQDFSLERMVSMWVRINYFPLMLSLFLNVKLELYYVVPLHTAGFFMTMATCYGAKVLRDKQLLPNMDQQRSNMAAIGISLLIHVLFFETRLSGLLSWISREYEFRFSTDKYSAWFGMLCGFLWSRFQAYMQWCYAGDTNDTESTSGTTAGDDTESALQQQQSPQGKTQKPKNPKKEQAQLIQRGVGLGLLLLWFFGFGREGDKHIYNPRHPYIFWMPLAGWLMLRNSSKYLTELHSTVLEFMGKITLETYVLQFHVFMCQNVQSIPVVIPGSGVNGYFILKFANMLVTGAGFIGLAFYARQATVVTQNAITELVTDVKAKVFNVGGGAGGSSGSGGGEGESLMNQAPGTTIEDAEGAAGVSPSFQTPHKDKKDEDS